MKNMVEVLDIGEFMLIITTILCLPMVVRGIVSATSVSAYVVVFGFVGIGAVVALKSFDYI
jgi:hypothetical protein